MRQLHVIGFTSDHSGLVLSPKRGAKTGSFVLLVDPALLERIEAAREEREAVFPDQPSRSPRQESSLSPREIQARLRGGRTLEQVAAEAGVSVEWVERFAAPVLAEQAAAVERARGAELSTPRRGLSDRPLGVAVLRNLATRGVRLSSEELEAGWQAAHLADGDWLVSFSYRSRGRQRVAQWVFSTASGTLVSQNRLGTELGFVERARAAAVPGEEQAAVAALVLPRRKRDRRVAAVIARGRGPAKAASSGTARRKTASSQGTARRKTASSQGTALTKPASSSVGQPAQTKAAARKAAAPARKAAAPARKAAAPARKAAAPARKAAAPARKAAAPARKAAGAGGLKKRS
ncbi:MAG TPA: septation protein SepH [Acidimicrobiales bacterium]|nr:septation protein SepH [Acidimicrobiales bacterium]